MNTWNEPYPEDLKVLFLKAQNLAEEVLSKLKKPDCPALYDFFRSVSRKGGRTEIETLKSAFQELGLNYNGSLFPKKDGKINEYKGIYVFGEELEDRIEPVYVGISRTIMRRLKQHGFGKNHNECTLAYIIANEENYDGKFSEKRELFSKEMLKETREKVQKFKVVIMPVNDDFELYFLEVALAGFLKTKWNSFKTH
jgi:hypothetical protein